MQNKWYAVQRQRGDAWDHGSYDHAEAVLMLKQQGEGYIAIIDEENAFCVLEIAYEDIVGKE